MIEIKLLPNSEVEIIGEISAEIFMSGRKTAVKEFSDNAEIDGFRKGKIPEDILVKNIGIVAVLEKMAVIALEKEYPKIISEHKVRAIGRPEITLTKLAENNPLGFKVTTSVLPEITLPDYKGIAKKIMAKKEEVSEENKVQEKERRRMEILEKAAEEIKQDMPKFLVEEEKDKMAEEMKRNIAQTGLKWDDYLKHTKKTEEELKKDWEKDAIKRVKYGFILDQITEQEKIEIPAEELEKEAAAMMEYHKKLGQNLDKERVKNYLSGIMRNEKLFQMLENQTTSDVV